MKKLKILKSPLVFLMTLAFLFGGSAAAISQISARATVQQANAAQPALLVITANDSQVYYGQKPTNNGVTYHGFLPGDNARIFYGQSLIFLFECDEFTDVGEYPFIVYGYAHPNYEIEFVGATITILPAPLVGTLTVTGEAIVGETLVATYASERENETYDAQWLRNGEEIESATALDYVLTEADLGAQISVRFTGTGNFGASVISNAITVEIPVEPTIEPTVEPTIEPTVEPTIEPTVEPTIEPTVEPTIEPTVEPTVEPTIEPTVEPTVEPTIEPTIEPTVEPTVEPTIEPTVEPTVEPTIEPTVEPTIEPTVEPTIEPTVEPTIEPTIEPTVEPTIEPTVEPTIEPTVEPTIEPTVEPTIEPTVEPTTEPTVEPTIEPTVEPTIEPTVEPTIEPTIEPSVAPSATPSVTPSATPSVTPSATPSVTPSVTPSQGQGGPAAKQDSLAVPIVSLSVFIVAEVGLLLYLLSKKRKSRMFAVAPLSLLASFPQAQVVSVVVLSVIAVILAVINVILLIGGKKVKKQAAEHNPLKPLSVEESTPAALPKQDESLQNALSAQPVPEQGSATEEDLAQEEIPAVLSVDEQGAASELFRGFEAETGMAIIARYKKSFMAKLIQASDETKEYYSSLKNAMLSYKKTTARLSWNYESFNTGRKNLAKFTVRGKTLCVNLAIDPDTLIDTKYKVERTESAKYAEVPCRYKITSARRAKYALELVAQTAEAAGLIPVEKPPVDYRVPYESTEALVEKGLIKELITKETHEEFMRRRSMWEINKQHKDFVSAAEVDSIISDAVAYAVIDDERISAAPQQGKRDIVNVDTLCKAYQAGERVTLDSLKEKGIVAKSVGSVKVLARGTLNKPLIVALQDYSIQAAKMIVITGGKVIRV